MEKVKMEITGVSEKQVKYAEDLLEHSLSDFGTSQEKYEKVMSSLKEDRVKQVMEERGWTRNQTMVRGLQNMNLSGYYVLNNVTDAGQIIALLK